MAVTGANEHIGSAGLTEQKQTKLSNISKFFRQGEKNILGLTVWRSGSNINKFYNYCSQSAAH